MELYCASTLLPSPTYLLQRTRHSTLSSSNSVFFSNGKKSLSMATSRRVSGAHQNNGASHQRRLGCRCLFGLGVPELVVIAGVAALVFGPKQLPEVGRNIGKTVKSFQQAAKEFETELKKEPEDVSKPSSAEVPKAVSSEVPSEVPKAVSSEEEKNELETSGPKENI